MANSWLSQQLIHIRHNLQSCKKVFSGYICWFAGVNRQQKACPTGSNASDFSLYTALPAEATVVCAQVCRCYLLRHLLSGKMCHQQVKIFAVYVKGHPKSQAATGWSKYCGQYPHLSFLNYIFFFKVKISCHQIQKYNQTQKSHISSGFLSHHQYESEQVTQTLMYLRGN